MKSGQYETQAKFYQRNALGKVKMKPLDVSQRKPPAVFVIAFSVILLSLWSGETNAAGGKPHHLPKRGSDYEDQIVYTFGAELGQWVSETTVSKGLRHYTNKEKAMFLVKMLDSIAKEYALEYNSGFLGRAHYGERFTCGWWSKCLKYALECIGLEYGKTVEYVEASGSALNPKAKYINKQHRAVMIADDDGALFVIDVWAYGYEKEGRTKSYGTIAGVSGSKWVGMPYARWREEMKKTVSYDEFKFGPFGKGFREAEIFYSFIQDAKMEIRQKYAGKAKLSELFGSATEFENFLENKCEELVCTRSTRNVQDLLQLIDKEIVSRLKEKSKVFVPNLYAKTPSEADVAIRAAKLVVGPPTETPFNPKEPDKAGKVYTQNPSPGALVSPHSQVSYSWYQESQVNSGSPPDENPYSSGLNIIPREKELGVGQERLYVAVDQQGEPLRKVEWISTNEPVLQIDAKGVAVGKTPGTAMIIAKAGDSKAYWDVLVNAPSEEGDLGRSNGDLRTEPIKSSEGMSGSSPTTTTATEAAYSSDKQGIRPTDKEPPGEKDGGGKAEVKTSEVLREDGSEPRIGADESFRDRGTNIQREMDTNGTDDDGGLTEEETFGDQGTDIKRDPTVPDKLTPITGPSSGQGPLALEPPAESASDAFIDKGTAAERQTVASGGTDNWLGQESEEEGRHGMDHILPIQSFGISGNGPSAFHIFATGSRIGWSAGLARYTVGPSDQSIIDHLTAAGEHVKAAYDTSFEPTRAWPNWPSIRGNFQSWGEQLARSRSTNCRRQLSSTLEGSYGSLAEQLGFQTVGETKRAANCDSNYCRLGYLMAYGQQALQIAEEVAFLGDASLRDKAQQDGIAHLGQAINVLSNMEKVILASGFCVDLRDVRQQLVSILRGGTLSDRVHKATTAWETVLERIRHHDTPGRKGGPQTTEKGTDGQCAELEGLFWAAIDADNLSRAWNIVEEAKECSFYGKAVEILQGRKNLLCMKFESAILSACLDKDLERAQGLLQEAKSWGCLMNQQTYRSLQEQIALQQRQREQSELARSRKQSWNQFWEDLQIWQNGLMLGMQPARGDDRCRNLGQSLAQAYERKDVVRFRSLLVQARGCYFYNEALRDLHALEQEGGQPPDRSRKPSQQDTGRLVGDWEQYGDYFVIRISRQGSLYVGHMAEKYPKKTKPYGYSQGEIVLEVKFVGGDKYLGKYKALTYDKRTQRTLKNWAEAEVHFSTQYDQFSVTYRNEVTAANLSGRNGHQTFKRYKPVSKGRSHHDSGFY